MRVRVWKAVDCTEWRYCGVEDGGGGAEFGGGGGAAEEAICEDSGEAVCAGPEELQLAVMAENAMTKMRGLRFKASLFLQRDII